MAIEVERLLVGAIVTNCYLVRCSTDGEAVIDPGAEGERFWQRPRKRTYAAVYYKHARPR